MIVVGVELGHGRSALVPAVVGENGGHQVGREILLHVSGSSDAPIVQGGDRRPIEVFRLSRCGGAVVGSLGGWWHGDRRRSNRPRRRRNDPGGSGSNQFGFARQLPGKGQWQRDGPREELPQEELMSLGTTS